MHANNLFCDKYSKTVLFGTLFYLLLRNRNSLLKYSGNDHFNFRCTVFESLCGDERFTTQEHLLYVHVNNVFCDEYSKTVLLSKLSYLLLRYRNSFLKCMRKRVGLKAVQRKKILHVHANNVLCYMYSNTGIFSKLSYLFLRYRKSFLNAFEKIIFTVSNTVFEIACGDEVVGNLQYVHSNNVFCDKNSNTVLYSKLFYLLLRYRNCLMCMRKRLFQLVAAQYLKVCVGMKL